MGALPQAARIRQIRTHARNALLRVKIFLSKWEDLAKQGRSHLEAACNTITSATTWPLICTHALKGCQGIQPSGLHAIRRRYVSAKQGLHECVDELALIVHETKAVVQATLELDLDGPLFSCVSSQQFYSMLQNVVDKHDQQVQVYQGISRALPVADDLLDPKSRVCRSWSMDQSHVIIATWMLHIEVDRKAVDSVMELLDSDVRTV